MAFYALWSKDRNDNVQGVYSHETALSIYELSDVNPSKLNMTVPTKFRKFAEIPKILELHYKDLSKSTVQSVNGLKLTRPLQTLVDVFESSTQL